VILFKGKLFTQEGLLKSTIPLLSVLVVLISLFPASGEPHVISQRPFSNTVPTVNGWTLNVTSLNLSSTPFQGTSSLSLDQQPLGTQAFPQSVPAAPSNWVPSSISNQAGPANPFQSLFPPSQGPTLNVARPDFVYVPEKLSFEKNPSSSVTGQKGLDAGPGTAAGVKRFVPLGEF
jgi:hypothetical protein